MPEFAILMRERPGAWAAMPKETRGSLAERYYGWMGELRSQGVFRGGAELGGNARSLRSVDGHVVEGPFPDTLETLTGYFVVEAPDLDAATAIARGCPALTHRDWVEIREIGG